MRQRDTDCEDGIVISVFLFANIEMEGDTYEQPKRHDGLIRHPDR